MNSCWMARREPPLIVFPCCEKDLQMLIKNLHWMTELDGTQPFEALISQDPDTNKILAGQVMSAACAAFARVSLFIYDRVPMPRWPFGPNWAFQSTAWHIYERVGRPWFWCEADCVPLRSGWLTAWYEDYGRAGQPFMGSVVEGRGHMNGTGIYPENFPDISPKAMAAADVAWDWVMRPDTYPLTHHSKLLQHCWGIVNDQPHPYDGPPACFLSQAQVSRWVRPDAVLFHRSKDGTLIDRLREQRLPKHVPATAGGGCLKV